jgi:hypothetical protein
MPENAYALACALAVLMLAEPLVELGSSALLPEQLLVRLNSWLLAVGALSTVIAPQFAPAQGCSGQMKKALSLTSPSAHSMLTEPKFASASA